MAIPTTANNHIQFGTINEEKDCLEGPKNFISLKGKYELAELFSACKTLMNEAMCKVCLGIK